MKRLREDVAILTKNKKHQNLNKNLIKITEQMGYTKRGGVLDEVAACQGESF